MTFCRRLGLQSQGVESAPIVAIDVPLVGDARHKNWAKVVSSVDTSKSSGWAFVGEFISSGGIQDVAAGSVILVYGERGSRSNPLSEARVFTVHADGTLTEEGSATGRAWARTLRDTVEGLLESERPIRLDWKPDLELFSSEALVDELTRRGWTITPPPTS